MLVDDDVYIVKNSELPVGESLTDETSYSTYQYRKNSDMVSDDYYFDDRNYLYTNNCYDNFYWNRGCGCSYYAWNMYNAPYYSPYGFGTPSLYYGHGFYNAFGNYVYDPFSGMYLYNPYYDPYGYYGSIYNPYYYGSGYNYGGPYGYNQPTVNYNHHSGPRGSLSGFSNTSGRTSPGTLKMSTQNEVASYNPNYKSEYRVKKSDAPIGANQVVRANNAEISRNVNTVKPNYRPTTERINRSDVHQQRPTNALPSNQRNDQPRNRGNMEPRGTQNPRGNVSSPREGENKPTPSGRRN